MTTLPKNMEDVIRQWPDPAQSRFADIRETVHQVAQRAQIGTLVETLKWGQPSWLPKRPRIGTTLRCDWQAHEPDRLALFVHCQTSLIETLRTLYPKSFTFEGTRALKLALDEPLPMDAIDHCAFLTLTYHRKNT
ncbi:DUF1801 domain-containing protein [Roseobacter sp. EG26]|uniref:DUF1801 domain-containing protein n=1 Tax=Roseobacter sp. EG26 TaxID=3412477 RepID=UPI003CE4F3D1